MKKLFFAMACVIGLMTFASCDPEIIDEMLEKRPEVSFVAEEGFIAQDVTINIGEEPAEWSFKFKVAQNTSSESPLSSLVFSVAYQDSENDDFIVNESIEIEDPTGGTYIRTFEPETTEDAFYVISVTVKDDAGKENVAFVTIHYANPVAGNLGIYEGSMDIEGHLTSNEVANNSYDMDTTFSDIPVEIKLDDLGDNTVSAAITIEDRLVVIYGTKNDNTITFENFTFSKTIKLGVEIAIDFSMDMIGEMDGNTLVLSGDAVGHGETQVLVALFKVDMTGIIDGVLEKVVE